MLTASERLARQKSRPLLVELHRALTRLISTLTMMNTGAHPDDEQSGMLATMRFGYGMRIIVACSTRGEGGQNSLGPERSGALGVVRSREMEEAARILDADIAWLGHGPDDPVHDFGFSKNGVDTLARWGRERIIERLVIAYRRDKPDIVIPTFLDVPGQHGHHRAMTEAAEVAIALAADPAYLTPGLDPWAVAKYYLPAWSGGGDTYDDEVPPPNASVRVLAPGLDMPTGAAFDAIGEWSRAYHASQGMGRWKNAPKTEWPLHLVRGPLGAENDIRQNLPATLGELADLLPGPHAAPLRAAQSGIDAALRAFPDRPAITTALLAAADALEIIAEDETLAPHAHRLARKRAEIDAALLLAAGISPIAWAEPNRPAPGGNATLNISIGPEPFATMPVAKAPLHIGAAVAGDSVVSYPISVNSQAPLSGLYAPGFSSLGGNGELSVEIEAVIGGRSVRGNVDLEEPFSVGSAQSVTLVPETIILGSSRTADPLRVAIRSPSPITNAVLIGPAGWGVMRSEAGFTITPAAPLANGLYRLPLMLDGRQAYRQTPIAYPHIGRTQFVTAQALNVLALDLTLPEAARIGYVGGGSDRVGVWLRAMGLNVTDLHAAALAGDLSELTTIVVGTLAFGARSDLAAATEKLRDWVEAGGHLLTLYHRPSDGWTPDTTPPRRVVIGSPSLRWRVTDPTAPVDMLAPKHKLLTGPNSIGPDDWAGWDKERGLYFASDWDGAYEPLLAMHDAGEKPLTGALISAPIGNGRHTHTSLVLHHQLDRLVPGAFRLLANLVQPA
ncbi:MAG: LmbE family protein [Devosia sp.]|uniref:PIG-L family deacetylase n=1 Tax=Devosia sp. TaxID=1871048 RepID=UPI0026073F48|nr:PIG-L family deacetylase [Devosia sp.]MDB5528335.1 LmbE family protein [Devosia sp.]